MVPFSRGRGVLLPSFLGAESPTKLHPTAYTTWSASLLSLAKSNTSRGEVWISCLWILRSLRGVLTSPAQRAPREWQEQVYTDSNAMFGNKKPININNFTGLSRKWMGDKLFMCFVFPGDIGKHINKILRKSQEKAGTVPGQSRDNPVNIMFMSFLVYWLFPGPNKWSLRASLRNAWRWTVLRLVCCVPFCLKENRAFLLLGGHSSCRAEYCRMFQVHLNNSLRNGDMLEAAWAKGRLQNSEKRTDHIKHETSAQLKTQLGQAFETSIPQEIQIDLWPRYFWKVSRYTSHFYRDTFAKVCPPLGRK